MPIWLRRFTYNELNEFYEKEKAEFESHMNKNTITGNTKLSDIKKITNKVKSQAPDYVSSVGRKK